MSIAAERGIVDADARRAGARLVFEGFYKVRFQLGDAIGRSVMHAGKRSLRLTAALKLMHRA
ncbi:hypothetical protein [Bradyrhizobium liaoningense]